MPANEALRLLLSHKIALRIYGKAVSLGVQPALKLPSFIPACERRFCFQCESPKGLVKARTRNSWRPLGLLRLLSTRRNGCVIEFDGHGKTGSVYFIKIDGIIGEIYRQVVQRRLLGGTEIGIPRGGAKLPPTRVLRCSAFSLKSWAS